MKGSLAMKLYQTSTAPVKLSLDQLSGHELNRIVRASDSAGRLHLALAIVVGRIAVDDLTPDQVCDVCHLPPSYRGRVRDAARRLPRIF